MNGFLVIDKPGGMTSRDVVNRIQRCFPRKTKIGHTGTLDPLATGVLVVCIGAATRLADYVQAMSKSYTARFRLGVTSTTDDADGELTENPLVCCPSRAEIQGWLDRFVGIIEQLPPSFSALKVAGQRAHLLARKGDEVPLTPRPVRIDAIRLTAYDWPYLDLEVDCGKGTYIRSIARDLGEKLGCGGMVETLRRTRIGPYTATQGVGLDRDSREIKLLPLLTALADMTQMRVEAGTEARLRTGQSIQDPLPGRNEGEEIALVNEVGELVGIAERVNGKIRPTVMLNL